MKLALQLNQMDARSFYKGTPMRTPLQSRPYLGGFNGYHHTPIPDALQQSLAMRAESDGLIYGTTIVYSRAFAQIEKFVLDFEVVVEIEGEVVSEKIYRNQLNELELLEDESAVFAVDGRHIREFDRELYLQFIYFPAEMISCFDEVIKHLYLRYFVEPDTMPDSRARREKRLPLLMLGLTHLSPEQKTCVKDLSPQHIGRLVLIQGIVIRTSEVYPEMKNAMFSCAVCKTQVDVALQNARVQQPASCRSCQNKDCFQIMHNHCSFTDKQYIKFQELPELVAEGSTPSSLNVIAYDSNVDGFRPGDRVEVIGIYRTHPVRIERNKNNLRTVFDTYIDLISFNLLEENKFRIEQNRTLFSDQDKRLFSKMAERNTVIDDLIQSFSPSIFGQEEVKKGILTQLFGGTKKTSAGRGRFRSDINICLLGDPSTAKSQLLQQVHQIAPRSIYTSGRGSSAVGLTANVRKDPETREFVLQSGALVLSDLGICCIDEFDKMDENSRTILLEAMQQQTISIAKAGIVCQLNSRTAILAAANPVDSKYDPRKSVVENINLPPSLLSRFDLIFIMLDIPNETTDKKLATHILDFYSNRTSPAPTQALYTAQQLAKYITYARQYIHPAISQEAGRKLAESYLEMRRSGLNHRTISATPRQLESLIRMSEAFAKMRLSSEVVEEDVEMAIALIQKATLAAATDPATGRIDMDIINTGRSDGIRKKTGELAQKMKEFMMANTAKYRKTNTVDKFIEEFSSFGSNYRLEISKEQIIEAFKALQSDDVLSLFGQNKSNPQFKLQIITDFD